MAKQPKQAGKQAAGTNAQQVKKQNQQAAQGQGQFGTEFGAEQTDAQKVRKQNQQSQANKK
ncbi:gamma-type small acid-soluble spore protein [Halobacillus amylolyticus]|uniref:Small, acid-soluble spore protein gamma-type n=1 Tax=Halobacillus amylolyticus TaxID=2932259 RepID=A0ABY4HEU9_9BACI|nr:gamma-type small acid-soluble spore protein [Halobacillus amylolyticus]UOR13326.1 gamma-type small acid-soluble spore protein [Halobacillus amylolyticus]